MSDSLSRLILPDPPRVDLAYQGDHMVVRNRRMQRVRGASPAGGIATPSRRAQQQTGRASVGVPLIPFTSGAHEHTEPAFDTTLTPGAAATQLGPFDVPAGGYLRHIFLLVEATGGTLGAGVVSEDYPFNLLQSIQLSDVNGAPIFGPYDGYAALWANIWGGYGGMTPDPRAAPDYVATINTVFAIRIPIEISHRDGMGSLANQNAAAAFKVSLVTNPSTVAFTTAPTGIPSVRIRGFLESWTLPNEHDVAGRPQADIPPAHGTTSYHSGTTRDVASGANTFPVQRVGSLLRWIGFIARDGSTPRVRTANRFPDPASLNWDQRGIRGPDPQRLLNQQFKEKIPGLVAKDTGVFAYLFDHADHGGVGDDSPTFWWPTVQSSRIEVTGSTGGVGQLQMLLNDIAPAEVVPSERFVQTSQTGFTPQVGAVIAGQQ